MVRSAGAPFSPRACSSASLSSEAPRQNHETAKDYVLIFISIRHLILWKDCLNPSSTLLLCWCWVFANQHLFEKHCSGQFAHAVRGCCASDVPVLIFKLYDLRGMNCNDQKAADPVSSSIFPKARLQRGIRN